MAGKAETNLLYWNSTRVHTMDINRRKVPHSIHNRPSRLIKQVRYPGTACGCFSFQDSDSILQTIMAAKASAINYMASSDLFGNTNVKKERNFKEQYTAN